MKARRALKTIIGITLIVLLMVGSINFVVDPFFHYRKPMDGLAYQFVNQRYVNNGILRNFDYDSIIIGTSMTENFRPSEFNEFFDAKAVKVPYPGATYKELYSQLDLALGYKKNVRYVVSSLDIYNLTNDKDANYAEYYPDYLYDENPINDICYLLNMDTLVNGSLFDIKSTISGESPQDFDTYSSWSAAGINGFDNVLKTYDRSTELKSVRQYTKNDAKKIHDNVTENIIKTVNKYPDTEFYLFLPPYSIMNFDSYKRSGVLEWQFKAMNEELKMLLNCDNVHVFSFYDDFDLVCNMDNYKDIEHYGEWINSYILECMKSGEHQLTKDNYADYKSKVEEFYLNYDYDKLFE